MLILMNEKLRKRNAKDYSLRELASHVFPKEKHKSVAYNRLILRRHLSIDEIQIIMDYYGITFEELYDHYQKID